jgi:hypothetical protein
VTIVATCIADVSNVHCHFAFIGLVPPCSQKLGLSYLKTEVRGAISSLVTRTHARMWEGLMGFGEEVRMSRKLL